MQPAVHVAIVGGGVIGCAIAYHLSKSGVDVAVFDRGEIGAEASSAITGQAIAELIIKRQVPQILQPFSLTRFLVS